MADAFLAHVTANPGQRMEHIAKELGLATPELTLPVKKLLTDGKLRVQGQKRATQIIRLRAVAPVWARPAMVPPSVAAPR